MSEGDSAADTTSALETTSPSETTAPSETTSPPETEESAETTSSPPEKQGGCCKVFVGNISFNARDEELDQIFSEFGEISEAAIIKDRETGRSRGYGFVTFESSESAQKAIDAMNLKEIFGRPLNVKTADSKNTGGGGGGNYRRGGGSRNGYYRQNYNNGYGYDGGFGEYYNQGGYDGGYGYGGGYGGGPGPMS